MYKPPLCPRNSRRGFLAPPHECSSNCTLYPLLPSSWRLNRLNSCTKTPIQEHAESQQNWFRFCEEPARTSNEKTTMHQPSNKNKPTCYSSPAPLHLPTLRWKQQVAPPVEVGLVLLLYAGGGLQQGVAECTSDQTRGDESNSCIVQPWLTCPCSLVYAPSLESKTIRPNNQQHKFWCRQNHPLTT